MNTLSFCLRDTQNYVLHLRRSFGGSPERFTVLTISLYHTKVKIASKTLINLIKTHKNFIIFQINEKENNNFYNIKELENRGKNHETKKQNEKKDSVSGMAAVLQTWL
jgi:hypothetical protein